VWYLSMDTIASAYNTDAELGTFQLFFHWDICLSYLTDLCSMWGLLGLFQSRHTAIPPYCYPAILLSRHTAIPPYCYPVILLSRHTAIPPYCYPAILLSCRPIIMVMRRQFLMDPCNKKALHCPAANPKHQHCAVCPSTCVGGFCSIEHVLERG